MAQSELFQRGLEQLLAGNVEEASRSFALNEEAAGDVPRAAELLKQAEALLAKGELIQGAKLFEQVLERNPSMVGAYIGLARIALFSGELEAARVHASAAVRFAPRLGLAWTLLALVDEASGEPAAALPNLRKGVDLSPGHALCQLNLGRALLATGGPTEAVNHLVRAAQIEPLNADAHLLLAAALRESGEHRRAIQALESARNVAPARADIHAALADALFDLKEFRAARSALDQALARCGEEPALLEKALACAMALEDWAGAALYVQRELAVVPEHEQAWINLASLQLLSGKADKSEQTAKELLARKPDSWKAWYHLGNLYEAVPLEGPAEDAYRRAVALAPGEWKPLMNLAALLIQLSARDKNEQALELLQQAGHLAPPDEWRVTYNLALARYKLGERGAALAHAREVLTRWPDDSEARRQASVLEANLLEAT